PRDQQIAFVTTVMARQIAGLPALGRLDPWTVLQHVVGPRAIPLRIRQTDRWSDGGPWPFVRAHERFGPRWRWKTVILCQRHDGSSGSQHPGSTRSCHPGHRSELDDLISPESGRLCIVEVKIGTRRNDEHDLETIVNRLQREIPKQPSNGLETERRD